MLHRNFWCTRIVRTLCVCIRMHISNNNVIQYNTTQSSSELRSSVYNVYFKQLHILTYVINTYSTVWRSIQGAIRIYQGVKCQGKYAAEVEYRGYRRTYRSYTIYTVTCVVKGIFHAIYCIIAQHSITFISNGHYRKNRTSWRVYCLQIKWSSKRLRLTLKRPVTHLQKPL